MRCVVEPDYDGLCVQVEPELYGVDSQAIAAIDAVVHPSSVVWLPPRQNRPRAKPAPERAAAERRGDGRRRRGRSGSPPATRTRGQTAVMIFFGVVAALWSGLALLITVFGATDPQTTTGDWIGMTVFFWLVAAALAVPSWWIVRRTRRPSPEGR